MKRAPLPVNILAGGKIRSGRQNVTDNAIENAIDVGHALGAAVGVLKRGMRLRPVITFADRVESGSLHLDVFAGLGVGAGRMDRRGMGAFEVAIPVYDLRAALSIAGKPSGLALTFFVLALGVKSALLDRNLR